METYKPEVKSDLVVIFTDGLPFILLMITSVIAIVYIVKMMKHRKIAKHKHHDRIKNPK